MLTLTNPNMQFLLFSVIMIVIGAPAMIASTPPAFKNSLLSFDKDGYKIAIMGLTFFGIGLFVPDYAAAYAFMLGGIFIAMLGSWISLDDNITDKILETNKGTKFFIAATALAFTGGAVIANNVLFYNIHGLMNLILPIGGAMFFMMMMVLSASTPELKRNLLPRNAAGWNLIWKGALVLLIAPLAGINPALMIAAAVLGTSLVSLGILVALWDWVTKVILDPTWIPLYAAISFALFAWSRTNY